MKARLLLIAAILGLASYLSGFTAGEILALLRDFWPYLLVAMASATLGFFAACLFSHQQRRRSYDQGWTAAENLYGHGKARDPRDQTSARIAPL